MSISQVLDKLKWLYDHGAMESFDDYSYWMLTAILDFHKGVNYGK